MPNMEINFGSVENSRQAEIEAGRARLREMHNFRERSAEDEGQREQDIDAALQEDERLRYERLTAMGTADKAKLDRAASEVVDQAQTQLEAALHFGDRRDRFPEEPRITAAGVAVPENHVQGRIQTRSQQRAIEDLAFDNPDNVNMDLVQETTRQIIMAQAVAQPTPLANARGLPTEGRALNISEFADVELDSVHRAEAIPTDRMTPKTPEQAEQFASERTPWPADVVKPGWHEPEKALAAESVPLVRPTDPAATWRAPNLKPENAFAAIEEVERWPEEVQPPEIKDLPIEGTQEQVQLQKEGRAEQPTKKPALQQARDRMAASKSKGKSKSK